MHEDSGGRAAPVLARRYRLMAQIGRGGTARVLRAWDLLLDRPVAVKLFEPHSDPVGSRRFTDEAKLLAGMEHPGLVKVFDVGTSGDQMYLVLELIDGITLGTRIDREPLSPDEVSRLGARLASTLAYVHTRGVVHRDVKPGNILLDEHGEPHLADFGLAKLLAASGITASDRLVGTAAYLSPEQVLGTEVGPPADVYGLGLVLLECLTGKVEYPGLAAETVMARLNRPPHIPDGLPSHLAESLAAMTRIEPAGRPDAATCAELLRGTTIPMPRPSRLPKGKLLLAVGGGMMAVLGFAFPLSPADPAPPATPGIAPIESTLDPARPVQAPPATTDRHVPAQVAQTSQTAQNTQAPQAVQTPQTVQIVQTPQTVTVMETAANPQKSTKTKNPKNPKSTTSTTANGQGQNNNGGN